MEFLPTGDPVASLRAAREAALKTGAATRKIAGEFGDAGRFHATA
jgi:hypothetical protein